MDVGNTTVIYLLSNVMCKVPS